MDGVQTVVGQVEPFETVERGQSGAGHSFQLIVGQAERLERRRESDERGVRHGLDFTGRHDQSVERHALEQPGRQRPDVLYGAVQQRYGRRAGQVSERPGHRLERRLATRTPQRVRQVAGARHVPHFRTLPLAAAAAAAGDLSGPFLLVLAAGELDYGEHGHRCCG